MTRKRLVKITVGGTPRVLKIPPPDPSFTPSDIPGLFADFDPAMEVYSNGAQVGTVTNQSGNGKHLTATGVTRPTFATGAVNGKPAYDFDGTQYADASTAADWNFLHSTTPGATVFVVARVDAHASSRATLLDTGGWSNTKRGYWLEHDTRIIASFPENGFVARVTYGSGVTAQPTQLARGAYPGEFHVVSTRYNPGTDMRLRVDGKRADSDTRTTSTTSTSVAGYPLRMGGQGDGANLFDGRIARVLIYNATLSLSEVEAVENYLASTYAVPVWTDPTISTVQDEASFYDAFPGLCRAANGDLLIAYRRGTSHTSDGGDIMLQRSTNNGSTWSSPTMIYDSVNYSGKDLRDVTLTTLSDGVIALGLSVRTNAAPSNYPDGTRVGFSSDNGTTWGTLTQPNDGFVGFSRSAGNVCELGDGSLLFAVYGNTDGAASPRWVEVVRSTNRSTWTTRAVIGDTFGGQLNEPTLTRFSDGQLVMLIRNSADDTILRSVSDDNGITWTTPTVVLVSNSGCPRACLTPSGMMVTVTRRTNANGDPAGLLTSRDRGVTWTWGETLTLPSTGTMEYAQPIYFNGEIISVVAAEASTSDADIFLARWTEHT